MNTRAARLRRLTARHTPPQCPSGGRLHDMIPTGVYAAGRVGWTCAQCRYSTTSEERQ